MGFIDCGSVSAGRQVKMAFVNSVAKPPRDVRRRQEKFGTTSVSSAASTAAAAPIKSVLCCCCVFFLCHSLCFHHLMNLIIIIMSFRIRPATTDFTGEGSRPSSSQHNPSPGSSRSLAPGGGAGHAARDKPQVKSKDVFIVLGWSGVIKIVFQLSHIVCSRPHPPAEIAPMMARTIKAFKNRFSRR